MANKNSFSGPVNYTGIFAENGAPDASPSEVTTSSILIGYNNQPQYLFALLGGDKHCES